MEAANARRGTNSILLLNAANKFVAMADCLSCLAMMATPSMAMAAVPNAKNSPSIIVRMATLLRLPNVSFTKLFR